MKNLIITILAILVVSLSLYIFLDTVLPKKTINTNSNNSGLDYYEILHNVPIKKPAIYLYPSSTQKINVKLDINGQLITSIPEYNNGWNVTATPKSFIDNKYDYLFYENTLNQLELPKESWVVKYDDLQSWFSTNLQLLGLNQKETSQFMEYWLKRLDKNPYYQVFLIDNNFLNQNMKLMINPTPDTIIRLIFAFKKIDQPISVTNPQIITPQRNGFTVVEWGGATFQN